VVPSDDSFCFLVLLKDQERAYFDYAYSVISKVSHPLSPSLSLPIQVFML
jgi:hypothetical protein